MQKLKVFLADDHPIVRSGLRTLVEAQADMEIVGEAGDGAALLATVEASGAHVAVVDAAMPVLGGVKATQQLRERYPDLRVLALSAHEEHGYVTQMFGAGASGYVVKRSGGDEVVAAIRCVARGGTYIDPVVAGALAMPSASRLSDRETRVLRMIARGHALKEIAGLLEVSVRTVETYKERAMTKLTLSSRADIVRYAEAQGWLGS